MFVYLIARGGKMQNAVAEHKASQDAFKRVRPGRRRQHRHATQLEKLAGLRDKGVLTDEEFAAQKAKLLA